MRQLFQILIRLIAAAHERACCRCCGNVVNFLVVRQAHVPETVNVDAAHDVSRFQKLQHRKCQLGRQLLGQERFVFLRVIDLRAVDQNEIARKLLVEKRLRKRPVQPPRRRDEQHTAFLRGVKRMHRARGDGLVGAQQRSVQVEGNQAEVHKTASFPHIIFRFRAARLPAVPGQAVRSGGRDQAARNRLRSACRTTIHRASRPCSRRF